ncbi:hypothetical protein HOG48_04145 [Candidatus Peregrinibacteria bacterium]|jgi:3D (Asp-Asp-Asp) domain-containing protein|nr:hypothetical protein [Candidatus Peregrinibacteria bacterium]
MSEKKENKTESILKDPHAPEVSYDVQSPEEIGVEIDKAYLESKLMLISIIGNWPELAFPDEEDISIFDQYENEDVSEILGRFEDGSAKTLYNVLTNDWSFSDIELGVFLDALADGETYDFYLDPEHLEAYFEITDVIDEYMSRHDYTEVIGQYIDEMNDPVRAKDIIESGQIPRIITFDVSAYYSPTEEQGYYGKTSKDKETKETMYDEEGNKIYRLLTYDEAIELNGKGEVVKSGLDVAEGMIAASENYPDGTKIYLPGFGMCDVQDRGGDIVQAGEREYEYDRIDVWMGRGGPARENARDFGRDNFIEALVFGGRAEISREMEKDGWFYRIPEKAEQVAEMAEMEE